MPNETLALTATLRDSQGNPLTGRAVAWSTSAPGVATVSSSGLVSAVAVGSTTITATSEGQVGQASITVRDGGFIGPAGGTVTAADGKVTVQVPASALTTPTAITVAPVVSPQPDPKLIPGTAYDFGPAGVSFAQPVTLRIRYDATALSGANPAQLRVHKLVGTTWTLLGGSSVDVATRTVTGQTSGFSIYAVLEVVSTPGPQNLEVHQINVGWGSAVLVRGPDGSTVLLEAGNTGKGTAHVVPYLQGIGIQPSQGLDYTIAGHQHCDHVGGLDEVIQAGYNVKRKNFFNGSVNSNSCTDQWQAASATTTAGIHAVPAPGTVIALGNGASLTFLAVNGSLIGGGHVAVSDENDRSIAILVKYGGFDFLWASDLGGGDADNACTGRSTSQADIETALITAISPGGSAPLISSGGIDVLYVNHHGSESSTNHTYMNLARPAVAIIGVGEGQSSNFQLPRRSVVEKVLLAQGACVTVPPALALQTEEGAPTGAETSFAAYSVGDIRIVTDGQASFTVGGTGRVSQGPVELVGAGLPRQFGLDDALAPTVAALAQATGWRTQPFNRLRVLSRDERRPKRLPDGAIGTPLRATLP